MGRKNVQQITYDEIKEYGEFFRSMRKSIGFTLEQMANELELGIFRTTLSRWEKGISIPNEDIWIIEQRVRDVVKKNR